MKRALVNFAGFGLGCGFGLLFGAGGFSLLFGILLGTGAYLAAEMDKDVAPGD